MHPVRPKNNGVLELDQLINQDNVERGTNDQAGDERNGDRTGTEPTGSGDSQQPSTSGPNLLAGIFPVRVENYIRRYTVCHSFDRNYNFFFK